MPQKNSAFLKIGDEIGFTIITPVYNREDCLKHCIDSVVIQNYSNMEHWIIDDGSDDDTFKIIQEYASKYPWIKHHRFEQNKGVNAARNFGIKNATKNYILFLDSDDYFLNNALAFVNDAIIQNPGYNHYLFAQNDMIALFEKNPLLSQNKTAFTFADFLAGRICMDFVHVMATDLIRKFPFDEDLRIYEILNFLQIYKEGKNQLFVKEVIVNRERDRSDSVTKESRLNNSDALTKQYIFLMRKLELFEKDYLNYQAEKELTYITQRAFLLGIALEKTETNRALQKLAKRNKIKIPIIYKMAEFFRMSFVLRQAIFIYSRIKNS